MSTTSSLTFLCVMAATKGLYGERFLKQAKDMGVRVLVLTNANALHLEWPRHLIDGLYAVEDIFNPILVRDAVSYLARHESISSIVGLGEYDIEIAAALREHMRLPGLSLSGSYLFRDKLAMRQRAKELGIPVPEFVSIFNHDAVNGFMARVPGPWVIKPRTEASSNGIRKVDHPQAAWDVLNPLGDEQSLHLMERYLPGTVFHVDSVVSDGQILFAAAHQYGTPILELHTRGGIYTTRAIRRGSTDEEALQEINRQVIQGFGLAEGVTHIEYIKRHADGRMYFLEASARVGAGMIEELVEATSGLNLWAEWAKIEVARHRAPYQLPIHNQLYGGLAICMTPWEHVDLSRLGAQPGIHYLEPKPYHIAALVTSDDPDVVEAKVLEQARFLEQNVQIAHA